ncbi:MAG: efflux RND transporter periplasmic adaptor subunit [Phycisphaerae bacterium]
MSRRHATILAGVLSCIAGCGNDSRTIQDSETADGPAPATNRIDIPPTVRSNLGITFATVEVRDVARTIRVPGNFELAPEARREYRTMVDGRIELHVTQYAAVEPGQLLFTLDSPDWRALQQQINETNLKLEQAQASATAMGPLLAAHERHHDELQQAVDIWQTRVNQLEASRASGVVTDADVTQARGSLATSRANLAEVLETEAELKLRQAQLAAELNAQRERLELLLANAAALLSLPVDTLLEVDSDSPQQHPRWREIRKIEIRAASPGVVESLSVTNGAWVNESSLALTTVQPDQLRFRAMGLQADLPQLASGATAHITPPRTPDLDVGDSVAAELIVGLDAHPDNRTITLIARPNELRPWMRSGVSAFLEVVAEGSDGAALAIPRSAIVKDGITHVYFRRDPKNPNQAIRMEADMGVDDGRWVVIHSGLIRGDEVVLDGAYELKLATAQSGTSQKGGHFHADGSFHDEH